MTANATDFAGTLCGCIYEKELQQSFYDRIIFYIDGRILFERYIHGEAAGLVLSMWASGFDAEGRVMWDSKTRIASQEEALPKVLTDIQENGDALQFDGAYRRFVKVEEISSDKENGYGLLKVFKLRRRMKKDI